MQQLESELYQRDFSYSRHGDELVNINQPFGVAGHNKQLLGYVKPISNSSYSPNIYTFKNLLPFKVRIYVLRPGNTGVVGADFRRVLICEASINEIKDASKDIEEEPINSGNVIVANLVTPDGKSESPIKQSITLNNDIHTVTVGDIVWDYKELNRTVNPMSIIDTIVFENYLPFQVSIFHKRNKNVYILDRPHTFHHALNVPTATPIKTSTYGSPAYGGNPKNNYAYVGGVPASNYYSAWGEGINLGDIIAFKFATTPHVTFGTAEGNYPIPSFDANRVITDRRTNKIIIGAITGS